MNNDTNPHTLHTGDCEGCGLYIEIFRGETARHVCNDCRDDYFRMAQGWTPENSRD